MRIGVFDSGIGGITVLEELRRSFPQADFVYLGDTANVPYGTKSAAQVVKLSIACAEYLKSQNVDRVVVACNTASSLALREMREALHPIPVDGVVEPGIQAVLSECEPGAEADEALPVLILATRATVKSGAYGNGLRQKLHPSMQPIYEQACPLLVPLIEEGWTDHPVLHQTVAEYVRSYREKHLRGVALLGCTHYPWIQEAVEAALPGWKVVNSARAVAQALEIELSGKKTLATQAEKGTVEWVFTDPDAVPSVVRDLMEKSHER